MTKILKYSLFIIAAIIVCLQSSASAESLFTPISDLLKSPQQFTEKFVSVSGIYSGWKNAPGSPPVSRSDWVLCDQEKNAIYCTGLIPQDNETGAPEAYGKPLNLLAKVHTDKDGRPYLEVAEVKSISANVEQVVSVAQILFSPFEMEEKHVGLLGVLAKGTGVRGERLYLLADPTGAIKLGRMPKLYPKGTILQIRGRVRFDDDGLPMIDDLEIVSAKSE
jgi:hypothetical protein